MIDSEKIIPVQVGTDVNVYGMARSFHEAYGVKSYCIGMAELPMTKDSKICDVTIIDDLNKDTVFVQSLIDLAKKVTVGKSATVKPMLICAGDEYVDLAIRNQNVLSDYYLIPYPIEKTRTEVYFKDNFYQLCEAYGLPYPKTEIVNQENYTEKVENLTIDFPVAMKPADAAQQIAMNFEGQRKAYRFTTKEQILTMLKRTYDAGYRGNFLLQDFIPGGDSNMHTVNFYADLDSNVRMMTMGQQLLEDPSPYLVGNYVATMIEYLPEIEEKLTHFVKKMGYTGFGNFDIKYDDRDQQYKLIELNPRQGRSAFYATASGYNLVQYAVEDLIMQKPFTETVYANTDFLWLGVNPQEALDNVADPNIKAKMQALIDAGRYGNTLMYEGDKSIMRNHRIKKYYASYKERFAKKGENN